jgi:hypothetical protein
LEKRLPVLLDELLPLLQGELLQGELLQALTL